MRLVLTWLGSLATLGLSLPLVFVQLAVLSGAVPVLQRETWVGFLAVGALGLLSGLITLALAASAAAALSGRWPLLGLVLPGLLGLLPFGALLAVPWLLWTALGPQRLPEGGSSPRLALLPAALALAALATGVTATALAAL